MRNYNNVLEGDYHKFLNMKKSNILSSNYVSYVSERTVMRA